MPTASLQLITALDALELRASVALRQVPGAQALLLFGSRVAERNDPYADLDLHLVTSDLIAARSIWPAMLSAIGPLAVLWPLSGAPDNTAYSVVFADESAYHKLDISLGSGPGLPAPLDTADAVVLWEQPAQAPPSVVPASTVYCPAWGCYGHLIVEDLLSSVRYLKARRRGHVLTAWRFVRSKPDLLLRLLAARQFGIRPAASLDTWAIKRLEPQLADAELAAFFAQLDWRSPSAMDAACIALTRQIIDVATALAETAGEAPPYDWIGQQLAFIMQELPART